MWPIQKQKGVKIRSRFMIFVPELSIFLVKVDQYSGGSDGPSIVSLGIVEACDTDQ